MCAAAIDLVVVLGYAGRCHGAVQVEPENETAAANSSQDGQLAGGARAGGQDAGTRDIIIIINNG